MSESRTSKDSAAIAAAHARRSTRIFQAVPLSISGQNRIGNLFLESTSAVSVNCHGCLYPSRHEYRHGSWVTIEVPNQQVNSLPRPVRAQVKFVRLPSNPQELYLVGVELENPANVWGIKAAPEDWLRFPTSGAAAATPLTASAAIVTTAPAPEAPALAVPGEPDIQLLADFNGIPSAERDSSTNAERAPETPPAGPAVNTAAATAPLAAPVTPEQLLRLMEGKLQQVAEKAVAAALNSRLNTAVNQAVKAIENFSQASLRQVEAHCSQYRETLVAAAREDLLGRMKADLAEAGEQLRTEVEAFSSQTLLTVHQLEKSAEQVRPILDAAQGSLQTTARELQEQFSTRVREIEDRATSAFNEETARLSQRQLARLAEKAHAAGGEASRAIDARSSEARLQLETAAGAALGEFHERAGIEIDLAVSESRKNIEASLQSLAAASVSAAEARQRTAEEQLARATNQNVEQFRQRLTNLVHSSLHTAMSAVNEHSSRLLQAFAAEATQEVQKFDAASHSNAQVAAD